MLLSEHIIITNIKPLCHLNQCRCWNSLINIITIPTFLEKLILAYNSYYLNAITMSFIFIWILVAHACVLLTNNWISSDSRSYPTSLLCRTPNINFWLVLDFYTTFIFGKFHWFRVLYFFHQNPIC